MKHLSLIEASEYLVTPNHALRDVMKKMSTLLCGCLVVADDKNRLLGTVSDGDIRRALLRGVTIDDSIIDVINDCPQTINISNEDTFNNEFNLKGLMIVPCVDNFRQLTGLYVDGSGKDHSNTQVIIMAGGFGTRLGSLTRDKPKALVQLLGKPLIDHVIDGFVSYGFSNFTIITNHFASQIEENFLKNKYENISVKCIREKMPMGTAGGLSLALKGQKFSFVINCDIISDFKFDDIFQRFKESGCDFLIPTVAYSHTIPFGVVENSENTLDIIEKPTFEYNVLSGVYLFKTECFKQIPPNEKLDMPDFLKILAKNYSFKIFPCDVDWFDVGKVETLMEVQRYFGENDEK